MSAAGVMVKVTFQSANPNTVWNRLTAKLGRVPTHDEATAEVKRILSETPTLRTIDYYARRRVS